MRLTALTSNQSFKTIHLYIIIFIYIIVIIGVDTLMTLIFLGNEVDTIDELVEAVLDDITIDDLADDYGCVQKTIDLDYIHDRYCYLYEDDDEEYKEFERILNQDTDFTEIELDFSDPWDEARRYYYSTRGC